MTMTNVVNATRYVDVPNQLGRAGRLSFTGRKQQRCYFALVAYIQEHGESPTMRELAHKMGVRNDNRARASEVVAELAEQGWLSVIRDPDTGASVPRGIRLLEPVLADLTPLQAKVDRP